MPLFHQPLHIGRTDFVARVAISGIARIVDTQIHTLPRNGPQAREVRTIAQMTDDDAIDGDILFPKQRDLLESQFAEVRGVRNDAHSGPALRPAGRPEYPLL